MLCRPVRRQIQFDSQFSRSFEFEIFYYDTAYIEAKKSKKDQHILFKKRSKRESSILAHDGI